MERRLRIASSRHPLSLHGLPPGGLPRFISTMRMALTTGVLPSGSVSLAFGTTRASSTFRSRPARLAYLVGPGIGSTGCSLSGGLRVETTVPPKFLGNPNVSAPRSLTPLGSPALLASTRQLLPARSPNGTTSGLAVSGLDHAAHSLPVYASQRLSPMPPRKTRFQRSPTLLGGSAYPLGFNVRFQSIALLHDILLT